MNFKYKYIAIMPDIFGIGLIALGKTKKEAKENLKRKFKQETVNIEIKNFKYCFDYFAAYILELKNK